ncbi:MAG: hypothetical protein ACODAJ_13160 [Planctomycetota bacterium]
MSLNKLGQGVLAVLVIVVTALVVKRWLVSERDRVARVVHRLADHLESRDVGSFCLLLAEDFTDSYGQDRGALRTNMTQAMAYLESISIRVEELEIEIREPPGEAPSGAKEARADFLAVCSARGRGRSDRPPWRWQTRVRLTFRKRDGEWRVVHAEYALPRRARP